MRILSDALRAEHKEFWPAIERIRRAAEAVDCASVRSVELYVQETFDFLVHDLLPHARAEEEVLYPAFGRAVGSPRAAEPMSREHTEVERYTSELGLLRQRLVDGGLSPDVATALRRVLYGLFAVIQLHLAKEEEFYLPRLEESLSEPEARELLNQMGESAKHARRAVEVLETVG